MHVIDLSRTSTALLLAIACVLGSATVMGETPTRAAAKTLSVESVSYCRPDNELILAQVSLVLRVTNNTGRPLIVSRTAELTRMVFKQPLHSKFQTVHFDRLDDTGAASFDMFSPEFASSPGQDTTFTVVKQGESSFLKVTAPIPVERPGITEGKFVLSVWPYSGETAMRLKNKWSAYGDLLTDDFQSPILKIVIDPPSEVNTCSRH